ncbi:hypothetical protein ACHAXA_005849 [Cyclostephanos tholiformis]|uniref:MANSC domain-containing protein n=1 Tax=Cyclostephanos tholiformis TaxID=382380 RepID=A0ABD3RCW0_9STRA
MPMEEDKVYHPSHDSARAPSIKSSESGGSAASNATPLVDNRVLQKILSMHTDDQNEYEHDTHHSSSIRYRNFRENLTNLKEILEEKSHNLKDNLATRATLLGEIIINPRSESNLSRAATLASQEDQHQPEEADHGHFSMLHRSDSDTYVMKDSVMLLPTNFTTEKKNRNRRETVESTSMWSAAAFFFDRSVENEHELSCCSESSSEDDDSIHEPKTNRHDRQHASQWDKLPINDFDEEKGLKKHKAKHRESWIGLDVLQGNIINQNRRATITPFIDDEGESYYGLKTRDGIYYRPGQRTINRCIAVLFAIAVTAISSVLIGLSVQKSEIEIIAKQGHYSQDDLFNMAKSVDEHCHTEHVSTANGRWECQQICHDHICCFDVEDSNSGHNCRNDENMLCTIFAPCEVLFVQDFAGSSLIAEHGSPIIEDQHSVGSSTHPGAANDDHISPEVILEDGLEWQQIREKYIIEYCAESNVKHEKGRNQCAKACANHYCCFDTSNNGNNYCRYDKSMICDVYSACEILFAFAEKPDDSVDKPDEDAALDMDAPNLLDQTLDDNNIAVPPDMIGETLLPSLMAGGMPATLVYSDDLSDGEVTTQELLQIKDDVQQRCSSYQTPIGRLHCENVCKDHLCCFAEDGCQDNPAKLCQVYDMCKVLAISASAAGKDEVEENELFQMGLILPEFEEEFDRMPTYVPSYHVPTYMPTYVPTYVSTYVLTSNRITLKPTLKPAPRITPKPTPHSAPQSLASSPNVPSAGQISTTVSTVKPPRPPPIRCIPSGDDEVNTEIYSDDWNDDRFNRCERWEEMHDMTIREYWKLYGISNVENALSTNAEVSLSPDLEDLDNSIIDNEVEYYSIIEELNPLDDLDDSIIDRKDEYDSIFNNENDADFVQMFGNDELEHSNP